MALTGSPTPDADEVRGFYDDVAPAYARLLPGPTAEEPLDLAMLDELVRRVSETPGRSVLDAGCGTGRMIPLLTDAGLEVTGADLSPGMIAIARERHPSVRLEVAGLDALPFDDGSFDGVPAWYSIIHTAPGSLGPVLSELRRVLRPGGHLLLAFQAGAGTRRILRGYGTEAAVDAHLHDPDDVAERLRRSGLAVDAVLRRAAVRERHDQGFVLAHMPADARNDGDASPLRPPDEGRIPAL